MQFPSFCHIYHQLFLLQQLKIFQNLKIEILLGWCLHERIFPTNMYPYWIHSVLFDFVHSILSHGNNWYYVYSNSLNNSVIWIISASVLDKAWTLCCFFAAHEQSLHLTTHTSPSLIPPPIFEPIISFHTNMLILSLPMLC